jgi:hypothetical protein
MKSAGLLLGCALVLSLPFSLGAQCGWVVWEKVEIHTRTADKDDVARTWELHAASETKDDCEAMLTRLWEFKADEEHAAAARPADKAAIDDITATRGFVGVTYHDKEGHQCWATHAYYCLPATLDPRGPKS